MTITSNELIFCGFISIAHFELTRKISSIQSDVKDFNCNSDLPSDTLFSSMIIIFAQISFSIYFSSLPVIVMPCWDRDLTFCSFPEIKLIIFVQIVLFCLHVILLLPSVIY